MPRPIHATPPAPRRRAWLALLSLCAAPALGACPDETPAVPTGSESSTSSDADADAGVPTTTAAPDTSTTAFPTSSGPDTATSSASTAGSDTSTSQDPTTGEPCPPGEPGCTCLPGQVCADGLMCAADVCVEPAPASCGDGAIDRGEECDAGPANGPGNACKGDCSFNVCGDGDVGPGELCDDGNQVDDDACTAACTLASCGDGVIQAGEMCDDGDLDDADACTAACTPALCGDGIFQPVNDEACDAGPDNGPGKACKLDCSLNTCGDGDQGPGESCDDDNTRGGDGCSAACKLEVCGDGVIDQGEACDDGDADNDDACTELCAPPACGDGFVQPSQGEACDDGNQVDTDECTNACEVDTCGDAVVQPGEVCDDGNMVEHDGCTSACLKSQALDVDSGGSNSCAILDGGAVRCWGLATGGKLGYPGSPVIGDNEHPSAAGPVMLGGPAAQITLGTAHTCVRMVSGDVRCWGSNQNAQLGLGHKNTIGDNEHPGTVPPVMLGAKAIDISTHHDHTCAVLEGGAVRCWGFNLDGQLGLAIGSTLVGDDEHPTALPTVQLGGAATQVAVGNLFSCALMAGGAVRCWGSSGQGELGLGISIRVGDDEHPVDVPPIKLGGAAVQIAAASNHACAILAGGAVRCWGLNSAGALGYPGSPTNVGKTTHPDEFGPVQLSGNAVAIDAAGATTCAILDTGALRCWGHSLYGQLGRASTQNIGDDEHPNSVAPVMLGGPALSIGAGNLTVCARYGAGAVRCWGRGADGLLGYANVNNIGDNEHANAAGPVQLF